VHQTAGLTWCRNIFKALALPEWEYTRIDLNNLPGKASEIDVLNDAGKDGWELVLITTNNIVYLKRQIEKPTAKSAR
jgi:hypothetical protein